MFGVEDVCLARWVGGVDIAKEGIRRKQRRIGSLSFCVIGWWLVGGMGEHT